MLTPAENAVSWLWGLVESAVESLERPVVVKVHGVCSVDGLEAVVECDCWWPHFREHVVLHQVCFAVHEI